MVLRYGIFISLKVTVYETSKCLSKVDFIADSYSSIIIEIDLYNLTTYSTYSSFADVKHQQIFS